jgi:thioredoxin 1
MLDINNGISLVKFAATWCAPCKMLSGTIKKIQPEFPDVRFSEVDIDDNPGLAKDYKIRSVPTLILFKDGEEISKISGSLKVDALRKVLRDIVKEKAA